MTTPATDTPSTSPPARTGGAPSAAHRPVDPADAGRAPRRGAGAAYWLWSDLDGNINGVDINEAIGDDRPEKLPTSGQNILILGSDSRAGDNAELNAGKIAAPAPTRRS